MHKSPFGFYFPLVFSFRGMFYERSTLKLMPQQYTTSDAKHYTWYSNTINMINYGTTSNNRFVVGLPGRRKPDVPRPATVEMRGSMMYGHTTSAIYGISTALSPPYLVPPSHDILVPARTIFATRTDFPLAHPGPPSCLAVAVPADVSAASACWSPLFSLRLLPPPPPLNSQGASFLSRFISFRTPRISSYFYEGP